MIGNTGESERVYEREREESRKVGWPRIVTRAGLRGPGGQEAMERGTRRFSPKGEKRYLAVCDSNNESEPPREVLLTRRLIVATLMRFLFLRFLEPSCSISSCRVANRLSLNITSIGLGAGVSARFPIAGPRIVSEIPRKGPRARSGKNSPKVIKGSLRVTLSVSIL